MPLSEHEQRLLDQMERAILTEDPRFASTFRDTIKQVGKKSQSALHPGVIITGILVGVVALLTAVTISLPVLGVFGFVVIVFSVSALVSGLGKKEKPATKSKKPKKSFMQGLEERWDNRSEN
ncbi:MAG: DUF3040 domain-containing protein [Actinobacteria bacterium]|nr:DUF3040 domain-containing protein [Actinomycetota bacterium]NBY15628.1 DUF3040 domain-containing protein [Actinomycetota bacterium]